MIRWIGKDREGHQRVYGEGATADIAETRCRDEAMTYLRRRPDTGPLTAWTFERENAR